MEVNTVVRSDCVEFMREMENDSVDLIVADPPYNLSLDSGDWEWGEKSWDMVQEDWDADEWSEYQSFTTAWMREAAQILKPEGSIWVFCSYHNSPYANLAIRRFGEILNEIIWYKRNAFPNMSGRRFTASHETIYWGHLNGDDREYKFNYEAMKEGRFHGDSLKRDGKQMRTVWDIPTTKEKWELEHGTHPTQKPVSVLERMLQATTDEDDTVFDPFAGSGSTLVAAKRMGRDYLGCDVDEEFVELTETRLDNIRTDDDMSGALSW